ncbi:protoheme IX farnesyltransferase [Plectosphaerella plurivora]|uniref:Protoheme IX farnesyltransferase, mitochondrial n=1 Tax=Plectosphaerella plurivora TaxID=936078 RepID=A0A9P8UPW9_9PEZI|nr:protoheme IX farnesyltransferase [Plectosphaerella plurivora]
MRPSPRTLWVRGFDPSTICHRCTTRLPYAPLSVSIPRSMHIFSSPSQSPRLNTSNFLPKNALDRAAPSRTAASAQAYRSSSATNHASPATESSKIEPVAASRTDPTPYLNTDLPHRRRQAQRKTAAGEAAASGAESRSDVLPTQDASSALTTAATAAPVSSFRRQALAFLSLTKPRLSALMVLMAMAPYALYPVPAFLSPAVTGLSSLSPLTLLFLTTGTALCSASANTLNMLYETATDARMSRTRNRPLVRKLVSTRAAILFAIICAVSGTGALYYGVNPTVSFLGFANIAIYAGIYTPLKAVTVVNTWIGAVVGGIPPLMGWAAAAGETVTSDRSWRELLVAPDGGSVGGWLLAGLLFAWQFPHFMALSWSIRDEYRAAGLRMLAWTNPARNLRVALRYSIAFIPLCLGLCTAGVTEWSFAVTSMPVNGWLIWHAVRFWRFEGHKGSAKGLFWASIWHLPGIMLLALLQKKGMWTRVWRSIVGEELNEWEEDELDEMPVTMPSPVSLAKACVLSRKEG